MANNELERFARKVESFLKEVEVRIRRYTMDTRLDAESLKRLSELHDEWLLIRKEFYSNIEKASASDLRDMEQKLVVVDRRVDLIQRELVSAESYQAGTRTALLLSVALVALGVVYLWTHGVRSPDFKDFEPLAEWGPLKYVEVAYWSEFGVLCYLLFLAAHYVSRRDFDRWYQPWYLATALRAPFLSVVLMMLLLEFTEWSGEGTWIETYLLEEGNKFFFIAFLSFCLGLASDQVAEITRDLFESVAEFFRALVAKISNRLRTAIARDSPVSK